MLCQVKLPLTISIEKINTNLEYVDNKRKTMKNKIYIVASSLLTLVFTILAIMDFSNASNFIKDIVAVLIFATLTFLLRSDQYDKDTLNSADEQKNFLEMKSSKNTVIFIKYISFILFTIFIIAYMMLNNNLVLGIIAITSLFYWNIVNIVEIINGILLAKKS